MKPTLRKENGRWVLRWAYHPRSFNTFGMSALEFETHLKYCVQKANVESWEDGMAFLINLDRRREVRRPPRGKPSFGKSCPVGVEAVS